MEGSQAGASSSVPTVLAVTATRLHLAPEGASRVLGIAAAALVAWLLGLPWLALPLLILTLAVAAFFRDPERVPPRTSGVVLSGADGRITDTGEATLPGSSTDRFRRVSVFMSPLNVHVNRASVSGEVIAVEHMAGEFRAAFSDHASEHNERNLIVFQDLEGRRHPLVQVAGYLARRIVCRVRQHDRIEAGQRIGLIMFGSRVDHYLPLEYRITVKIGDRVRAGESILGELAR